MKEVMRKNKLENHVRCHTDIVDAVFRKESGTWLLTDSARQQLCGADADLRHRPAKSSKYTAVSRTGNLWGRHFHTAAWDHTCDLAGKKVAVIGTGASAIQVIPEIAPQVEHLTVFQRTPAWVTPRRDKAINEQKRKKLLLVSGPDKAAAGVHLLAQ
jgi:cation diffusion facilitator CzcD-associated flavoprotein CzcO